MGTGLSNCKFSTRAVLVPCGGGRRHVAKVKESTGSEEVEALLLSAEVEEAGPFTWAAHWNHLERFSDSAFQPHSRRTKPIF